jgi:hypothetical protein
LSDILKAIIGTSSSGRCHATHARYGEFNKSPDKAGQQQTERRIAIAKSLRVQILERARALIADERHWCPRDLARDARGFAISPTDDDAVQRCALGALIAAAHELTGDPALARHLAATAVRPLVGPTALTHINDAEGHPAALALFDLAIHAHDVRSRD